MIENKIEEIKEENSTDKSCFFPIRFFVYFMMFLSNVICYADRANISIALIPMAAEFGWDKATQGYILSSFYIGYIGTQFIVK
jgi:sugar phosphate permease